MKKVFTSCLLTLIIISGVYAQNNFIAPVNHFAVNFCNFPTAWNISKGEGVNIGIICQEKDTIDWTAPVKRYSPNSTAKKIPYSLLMNNSSQLTDYKILVILSEPKNEEYDKLLNITKRLINANITVVLPAYFSEIKDSVNYTNWINFINKMSDIGCVITAVHGRQFEIGSLDYWANISADIFALNFNIDSDKHFKNIKSLGTNSLMVAGGIALLLSRDKFTEPKTIKKILKNNSRNVLIAELDVQWEKGKNQILRWAHIDEKHLAGTLEKYKDSKMKLINKKYINCFDAAILLGVKPFEHGEWTREVLKIKEAQKYATGKGVTVAILDWLFNPEDPSLKGRIVKPGSVVEGEDVFYGDGHGTWMAKELVEIAPDVKIMPVRFCGNEKFGNTEYYAKGIDYAVENGAQIITCSHQAVEQKDIPILDEAIKRASAKGVTFVYIHYYGNRNDVIVTSPIEFSSYRDSSKTVFVIGTNFYYANSFPYTWGVSQTAPIVGGVIALMKEINPRLQSEEIRNILLRSGTKLESGYYVLDAESALKNCQPISK